MVPYWRLERPEKCGSALFISLAPEAGQIPRDGLRLCF
jgi:hypothetical protein